MCFSCGVEAPESHMQLTERIDKQREKSGGDWVCGGCSSVNFASRLMCFVCSRPRPPSATISGFSRVSEKPTPHHEVVRVGEMPTPGSPRRPSGERLDMSRTSTLQTGDDDSNSIRTVIQSVSLSTANDDNKETHPSSKSPKRRKKKKKQVGAEEDDLDLDALLTGGSNKGGPPREEIPGMSAVEPITQSSIFDDIEDPPRPPPTTPQHSTHSNEDVLFSDRSSREPPKKAAPSERHSSLKAGDWLCPKCGAHCFASRHVCFQCGGPRPSFLHLSNTSKARGGQISTEELAFSLHAKSQGQRPNELGQSGTVFACNNGAGRDYLDRTNADKQTIEGAPKKGISGSPASTLDVRVNHEVALLDRIQQFDTSDILSPDVLKQTETRDRELIFNTLRGKLLFGDKKFPEVAPEGGMDSPTNAVIDAFKIGDWRCAGCGFSNFSQRTTCKNCMTHKNTFPTLASFPSESEPIPLTGADEAGLFTVENEEVDGRLYAREIARRIGEFATMRLILTGRMNITLKRKSGSSVDVPIGGSVFDNMKVRHSSDSTAPRRGDWWCNNCKFLNFAARLTCKNCRERRENDVKVHVGSSREPSQETTAETLTTASGIKYIPNSSWASEEVKSRQPSHRSEQGVAHQRHEGSKLKSMVVSLDSLLDEVLGEE